MGKDTRTKEEKLASLKNSFNGIIANKNLPKIDLVFSSSELKASTKAILLEKFLSLSENDPKFSTQITESFLKHNPVELDIVGKDASLESE